MITPEARSAFHPQENRYEISVANVLDKATIYGVLWPVQKHIEVARAAGYDGIELWPIRPVITRQITKGTFDTETRAAIASAHQSPRTDTNLKPVIILPKLEDSLRYLERVRHVVGDIPVVLYRETPQDFHHQTQLTQQLIQPDPEVWADWEAKDAHDFLEKPHERAFTGVCLDTNHIRRPHKQTGEQSPMANWEETLPVLLSDTKEIHVGIRTDLPAADKETAKAELMDLLYGTSNSELMRMLQKISDTGWRGNVVIELTASAVREVLGKKSPLVSSQELINTYERARNTLYKVFQ